MTETEAERLVGRFASAEVDAVVLAGSYARGEEHRLSDVDLMLFASESAEERMELHVIEGKLHVVSRILPAQVETWFTHPKLASEIIQGLRTARILFERGYTFTRIQKRAHAFRWDSAMQAKADAWTSSELAKLAEEVQKGLSGLQSGHVGRLLNARFGLSWGLSQIMQVDRGVLLSGDNAFMEEVEAAVGDRAWIEERRRAFSAVPGLQLRDQVAAGLRLYLATARLLDRALQPQDRPVVEHAVRLIESERPTR